MKNVKELIKNNIVFASTLAGVIVVTSGIAIASGISSNNAKEVTTVAPAQSIVAESTIAETVAVVEETTTVVETQAETVAEVQAPVQMMAVVQEVATEAPTEAPTQAPKPIFDFIQVDGGYVLSKINDTGSLPSTLEVPSTYNGLPVVAIGDKVLANIPITTFIIPSSIKSVGKNLCGSGCDCPTLKAIVCQGETPFSLISFSLDEKQLKGGCTIYVPNIESYSIAWKSIVDFYKPIMKPLSEYK